MTLVYASPTRVYCGLRSCQVSCVCELNSVCINDVYRFSWFIKSACKIDCLLFSWTPMVRVHLTVVIIWEWCGCACVHECCGLSTFSWCLFVTWLLRPKLHSYTGCKRTCSVEQAVLCIWPVHEAKRALLSTGGSLELGSLHTRGALFWESTSHQPRVLIGYWVNQLSSVKWRGGETFRLVQRTTD